MPENILTSTRGAAQQNRDPTRSKNATQSLATTQSTQGLIEEEFLRLLVQIIFDSSTTSCKVMLMVRFTCSVSLLARPANERRREGPRLLTSTLEV